MQCVQKQAGMRKGWTIRGGCWGENECSGSQCCTARVCKCNDPCTFRGSSKGLVVSSSKVELLNSLALPDFHRRSRVRLSMGRLPTVCAATGQQPSRHRISCLCWQAEHYVAVTCGNLQVGISASTLPRPSSACTYTSSRQANAVRHVWWQGPGSSVPCSSRPFSTPWRPHQP